MSIEFVPTEQTASASTAIKEHGKVSAGLRYSLHWLPLSQRIYKALNDLGTKYTLDLLVPYKAPRPLRVIWNWFVVCTQHKSQAR